MRRILGLTLIIQVLLSGCAGQATPESDAPALPAPDSPADATSATDGRATATENSPKPAPAPPAPQSSSPPPRLPTKRVEFFADDVADNISFRLNATLPKGGGCSLRMEAAGDGRVGPSLLLIVDFSSRRDIYTMSSQTGGQVHTDGVDTRTGQFGSEWNGGPTAGIGTIEGPMSVTITVIGIRTDLTDTDLEALIYDHPFALVLECPGEISDSALYSCRDFLLLDDWTFNAGTGATVVGLVGVGSGEWAKANFSSPEVRFIARPYQPAGNGTLDVESPSGPQRFHLGNGADPDVTGPAGSYFFNLTHVGAMLPNKGHSTLLFAAGFDKVDSWTDVLEAFRPANV